MCRGNIFGATYDKLVKLDWKLTLTLLCSVKDSVVGFKMDFKIL